MTVRIKRLELHGFKSFPKSTVFEFDTGITAIIGPNGSGKSNIADAMRWVLGEQSYTNLRGRKAEDVIFSGSGARAAVGMAEVSLTLDNTSGELPVDFQEVSITRRAYRSGENQYLINGAKVRLKDVNQITASLGQSHTVIGQGLVDAALSQRPEERRSLFEHAAGITGLRLKHAATARHLAETEANSTRLEDLLNELEPRLKTLERQAKQAREYAEVQERLRETALRYYASHWREHLSQLDACKEKVAEAESELERATRELEQAQAAIETSQQELGQLREQARALDEQVDEKRRHLRETEHQIELTRQRRDGLHQEIQRQDERREALVAESGQIAGQIEQQQETLASVAGELEALDEQLTRRREERSSLESEIASLVEHRDRLDSQREELRQRIYRSQAEQEYRVQQRQDLEASAEELESRREALETEHAEVSQSIESAQQARAGLDEQIETAGQRQRDLQSQLEEQRQKAKDLGAELESIASERSQRAARLDALQRLQESGEGLYRGVQAVLDASQSGRLSGIAGTLASQIQVPAEYETAIEAALGGHLQDIVVNRWKDAEAAIAHLKKQNAGRATFQPLDTVRKGGGRNRPSLDGDSGVIGIAVDLVGFGPELEPVLEGLIGRTVVTQDLESTRRILGKLRPGWTVVTLEGEVTRSGGSVTGGSRVRQSGTLSRERELRELPEEIERLDARHAEIQSQTQEVNQQVTGLESTLEEARTTIRRLEGEIDAADRETTSLQSRLAQIEQALAQLEQDRAGASETAAERAREIEQLGRQCEQDTQELEQLDHQRAEIVQQIEQLQASGDDEELRRLESERSRLSERRQGLERELESLRARATRLESDLGRHDQERESTVASIARHDQELVDLQGTLDATRAELDDLSQRVEPLAAQRTEREQELEAHQRELNRIQQRQRELERSRDSHRFDVQRQETQGEHLLERVIDTLEMEDPVPLLEQQPVEEELDLEKLETSLHRLRQRARRIGAFGEDTIAQYEQEQERYSFLRGQLDDVQRGAEALKSMLEELEQSMATEFDRTFTEVAREFETTFQRLFGGGTAQLMRNDDESGVGIDIVAQPPGKRLQSLALLSGGERALTAVALLFAILRVNPSPFCLLDEVDAALDEANVVRFRNELRDLATNTQFVVVTHNRATIEGADVLYGITMGSDAVSRVVSLKLPEEAFVT